MTSGVPRIPCHRHPDVMAVASVPVGERGERYLCGACLRAARPVVYTSIPVPAPSREG